MPQPELRLDRPIPRAQSRVTTNVPSPTRHFRPYTVHSFGMCIKEATPFRSVARDRFARSQARPPDQVARAMFREREGWPKGPPIGRSSGKAFHPVSQLAPGPLAFGSGRSCKPSDVTAGLLGSRPVNRPKAATVNKADRRLPNTLDRRASFQGNSAAQLYRNCADRNLCP